MPDGEFSILTENTSKMKYYWSAPPLENSHIENSSKWHAAAKEIN